MKKGNDFGCCRTGIGQAQVAGGGVLPCLIVVCNTLDFCCKTPRKWRLLVDSVTGRVQAIAFKVPYFFKKTCLSLLYVRSYSDYFWEKIVRSKFLRKDRQNNVHKFVQHITSVMLKRYCTIAGDFNVVTCVKYYLFLRGTRWVLCSFQVW